MKVKELIEKLKEFDGELEVLSLSDWGYHRITNPHPIVNIKIFSTIKPVETIPKALLVFS